MALQVIQLISVLLLYIVGSFLIWYELGRLHGKWGWEPIQFIAALYGQVLLIFFACQERAQLKIELAEWKQQAVGFLLAVALACGIFLMAYPAGWTKSDRQEVDDPK